MSATTQGYRRIENADLASRNSFGVAARARLLLEVEDVDCLPGLFAAWAHDAPPLVLGGGSNVLFAGAPTQPVLSLRATGVRVLSDDGARAVVRADAGVDWHALVMRTLSMGLGGLENLALIPGTVGAAPIQNIGAYGVEVESRIRAVHVFERDRGAMRVLDREACAFAYRDSAFKRAPDRWIVTAVDFELVRDAAPVLDYAGLRDELAAMAVDAPTSRQVADAVIRIRRRKLPDPAVLGNAGSFFKNPVVSLAQADALHAAHPRLPIFPAAASAAKLSAAWLIDACGWKGHRDGDAGVSDAHALVLVNHGRATGAQLLDLARRIADDVSARFDVALEPEPRIVGATWGR